MIISEIFKSEFIRGLLMGIIISGITVGASTAYLEKRIFFGNQLAVITAQGFANRLNSIYSDLENISDTVKTVKNEVRENSNKLDMILKKK